jgi:hypothetical protein
MWGGGGDKIGIIIEIIISSPKISFHLCSNVKINFIPLNSINVVFRTYMWSFITTFFHQCVGFSKKKYAINK